MKFHAAGRHFLEQNLIFNCYPDKMLYKSHLDIGYFKHQLDIATYIIALVVHSLCPFKV